MNATTPRLQAHPGMLLAAPHRIWFFAGGLQLLAGMVWWMLELAGRYGGWWPPPAWSAPPGWIHGYVMVYTTLPMFVFGFLMTAVPNWLGEGRVPKPLYGTAAALMLTGALAVYAGSLAGAGWMALGGALGLAGWALSWSGLAALVWRASRAERRYPFIVLTLTALGFVMAACFVGWLLTGTALLAELARIGGVWFFLLPLFFNISQRMIPFFSSRALPGYAVIRPAWAVPVFTAASLLHGVLLLAGAHAWLWLPDLALFLTVAYLLAAWRGWRSFGVPLLAMLHIAFAVLGLALALQLAQSLAAAGGMRVLGLAPLHALGAGYFAAMLLAMVSRVSLGHSGRPLAADRLTSACFLGVLTAAALRLAAELVPVAAALMPLAGLAWLAAFGVWAARYLPIYLQPRVDGRPG